MTAVRGDLIATVLGSAQIDPETLTASEWCEIITHLSETLTIGSLCRMSNLREAILRSDIVSGVSCQMGDAVVAAAMPTGLNPNTAFLNCAHIALRPQHLPGEAKHILMSRDLEFYELTIMWMMGFNAPVMPRYYNVVNAKLEPRKLEDILNDYYKLRIGSKKDFLFGQWILMIFSQAQKDTVENLDRKLSTAQSASLQLNRAYKTFQKSPIVA